MDMFAGGNPNFNEAGGGMSGGMGPLGPQNPNMGGGQGWLQMLMQMLGHGGMGGNNLGSNLGYQQRQQPPMQQPPQAMPPTNMYAGGNPNFNEAGGYQAKPFMPPHGMPGGTPGPIGNGISNGLGGGSIQPPPGGNGMGSGLGGGSLQPPPGAMGPQVPQRRPLPVSLAQMGGMRPYN